MELNILYRHPQVSILPVLGPADEPKMKKQKLFNTLSEAQDRLNYELYVLISNGASPSKLAKRDTEGRDLISHWFGPECGRPKSTILDFEAETRQRLDNNIRWQILNGVHRAGIIRAHAKADVYMEKWFGKKISEAEHQHNVLMEDRNIGTSPDDLKALNKVLKKC